MSRCWQRVDSMQTCTTCLLYTSGNNISQVNKIAPEHSNLYGRFVPGSTGTLTIDGTTITE